MANCEAQKTTRIAQQNVETRSRRGSDGLIDVSSLPTSRLLMMNLLSVDTVTPGGLLENDESTEMVTIDLQEDTVAFHVSTFPKLSMKSDRGTLEISSGPGSTEMISSVKSKECEAKHRIKCNRSTPIYAYSGADEQLDSRRSSHLTVQEDLGRAPDPSGTKALATHKASKAVLEQTQENEQHPKQHVGSIEKNSNPFFMTQPCSDSPSHNPPSTAATVSRTGGTRSHSDSNPPQRQRAAFPPPDKPDRQEKRHSSAAGAARLRRLAPAAPAPPTIASANHQQQVSKPARMQVNKPARIKRRGRPQLGLTPQKPPPDIKSARPGPAEPAQDTSTSTGRPRRLGPRAAPAPAEPTAQRPVDPGRIARPRSGPGPARPWPGPSGAPPRRRGLWRTLLGCFDEF
jgi:hypothetical protein